MADNQEQVLKRLDDIVHQQKAMEAMLCDIIRVQRFRPDDRQEKLITAIKQNGDSFCWSDLRKFPDIKCQYTYREQFVRDMDAIAPFLGLINTSVSNKLVYHRPEVDPMASTVPNKVRDLSQFSPKDRALYEHLVQQIRKERVLHVGYYLDDNAYDATRSWKDEVLDRLGDYIQREAPDIERGNQKDKWNDNQGKPILNRSGKPMPAGRDRFRVKVP